MRTGAEDGELGCGSALANIPRIGNIRDVPDE